MPKGILTIAIATTAAAQMIAVSRAFLIALPSADTSTEADIRLAASSLRRWTWRRQARPRITRNARFWLISSYGAADVLSKMAYSGPGGSPTFRTRVWRAWTWYPSGVV